MNYDSKNTDPAQAEQAAGGPSSQHFAPASTPNVAPVPPTPLHPAPLADRLLSWTDAHRWKFFAALALLYIAGFQTTWRLEPDSGLYMSIGKSLAHGHGYTYHGEPHRLAYPGLPTLMAGLFLLFGSDSLLPAQVLMPLLGLATLALTYRLVHLFAGRPTAVLVTVGVGLSQLFFQYSFELRTDLPFALGVTMFLAGYEGVYQAIRPSHKSQPPLTAVRWYDIAFLVLGIVVFVTMRPAMWTVLFAAGLAAPVAGARLLLELLSTQGQTPSLSPVLVRIRRTIRRPVFWVPAVGLLAIVAAVVAFQVLDPRDAGGDDDAGYAEEDQMFHLNLKQVKSMLGRVRTNAIPVLGGQVAEASFGINAIPPLALLLGGAVLVLGIGLTRVRPLWGMLVLVTAGVVLLVPEPHARYFLPVLPLLVLGWWRGLHWLNHRLPARWGNWAFLALFALGIVPNCGKLIDFILEQRSTPFLHTYKEGRFASVYEMARMVRKHTPPSTPPATGQHGTWVLTPPKFARVLTFLSDRYAIEAHRGFRLTGWDEQTWQHVYVIEPSAPPNRNPNDDRPTAQFWLKQHGYEVDPEVIAKVPNADPDAKAPWTLHRVRRIAN